LSAGSRIGVAAVVIAAGALVTACAATPARPGAAAADGIPRAAIAPEVEPVLVRACYPCHSDARRDPWFAKIAPSSWSLQGAREVLDFSQWDRYDGERRATAMEMIADAVHRGSMPPADYTFFNHDARLDDQDRHAVEAWVAAPAH
jgi:hypothetical protein